MRQREHLFIFYDDDLRRHFAVVVVYHLRGVLAKICAVTSSGAICAKISRLDCYLIDSYPDYCTGHTRYFPILINAF